MKIIMVRTDILSWGEDNIREERLLRGSDYLNEIYDKNGKLKSPISGWVDPISGLFPIPMYYDSNRIYNLLAYQQIAGRYHADSLGYVQNTLKWNNYGFILDHQEVAIFGSQV